MLRRFLKWAGFVMLFFVVTVIILGILIHKPRPEVNFSEEAERLAQKMARAMNKEAWDSTRYIRWEFFDQHHYLWDKQRNFVEVKWKNIKVQLFTKSVTGIVYRKNRILTQKEASEYIKKAWAFFCNDSFWLIAPLKIFDPGTERSIVNLENGKKGLLVSYTSGGVTPGDAYLWILNDKGIPEGWKMWVSVLPVGGLNIRWENWKTFTGGSKIATTRRAGPFRMHFENVQTGNRLEMLGLQEDPFKELGKFLQDSLRNNGN